MKLTFGGGAKEIGASCIYLSLKEKGILMDAGIRQSTAKDKLPDFRSIQVQGNIDFIVISHAHMDHIGSLPLISKQYPNAPIYMTAMTKDLSRVLLYDSLKIMGQKEEEIPIYNERDVLDMMERIRIVKYLTPVEIPGNIKMTFYPAGHIAGAACIYLETEEGALFYSGDYSLFAQRSVEGARVPKLRPDIAITETTYGNRLHANRQAEENRLVSVLNECIEEGKKILIPSFALGRSQEVLLIIKSAMANGKLPKIPVFVDGMVRDINIAYTGNPLFLRGNLARKILKGYEPFYSDEITAVDNHMNREALLENQKGACIIVASSGMLSGGPSVTYASKLVSSEDACIILTGYQDEESPGRALLALAEGKEKTIALNGTVYPVKCRVEMVGLSAHADKMELISLMDQVAPRNIILVHGDEDAITEFSNDLSMDYRRRIYVPEDGETLDIEIRNKRKQSQYIFPYVFEKENLETEEDYSAFCQFWKQNYPRKAFTIEQTAKLLNCQNSTEEKLQSLQEKLLESGYFKRDPKRMFLLRIKEDEEILEDKKKKEVKLQDIEALVKEELDGLPIRKLSYYSERKTVVLNVDFPDVIDQELLDRVNRKLEETYQWKLELSNAMNFTMAITLFQNTFLGRCDKVSYFTDRKIFVVKMKERKGEDRELKKALEKKTGWRVYLDGEKEKTELISRTEEDDAFVPQSGQRPIEQNEAMLKIDFLFYDKKQKPYRKGIRSDANGKYLELSFISPSVGERYKDIMQKAADETGWRIKLSNKINQNEILSIAVSLCAQYGILLTKVPSYMAQDKIVAVAADTREDLPEELISVFKEETGMNLVKK